MLPGLCELLRGYNRLAASAAAPFLCCLESGAGSFPNEIAFELGQRPEQMEDQATAKCRGVDAFGDGPEADAFGLQFGDDLDEVLHRSAQAIEPPDRKRVAVSSIAHGLSQPRPIGFHTRCLVFEHFLAARLAQGIELQRRILVAGGYPCVADRGHEA